MKIHVSDKVNYDLVICVIQPGNRVGKYDYLLSSLLLELEVIPNIPQPLSTRLETRAKESNMQASNIER